MTITNLLTLALALLPALLATDAHAGNIAFTYDAAGRLVVADYGGNTNLFHIYDAAGNLTESSAPGPLLAAAKSPTQTTFAWTSLASGWTLVSTTSLRPPVTWTPVAVTPANNGVQFIANVNNPPGAVFFLLRKP